MRYLLASLLCAAMVVPLAAADKEKKKPNKRVHPAFNAPKGVTFNDDQKSKVEALKAEYGPKFEEAQKKVAAVLTPARNKERAQAAKEAKAAGKKGKDLQEAVNAAMKLTDQEKTDLAAAQSAVQALQKEVHGKVIALLTEEQKASLPKKKKGKK